MQSESLIVLSILGLTSLLFITKWVREDVVAVLALSALVLLGLVEPAEALSGFGSNAVVSIVALLIVSAGLVRSGAVNWIAARIQDLAGGKKKFLLILSFLIPGILSGFINIVGAVSVLIPLLLRIAKKNDIHPSKLLMPAVASGMAGANLSLIGASHNLVVNDLIQNWDLRAFDFFEFSLVGIILVAATVLYSRLLGPHLLKVKAEAPPKPQKESDQEIVGAYRLQARIWEVWIQPEAEAVGKPLSALSIESRYGLSVIMVLRQGRRLLNEDHEVRLDRDDVLLVGGRQQRVNELCRDFQGFFLMGQPDLEKEFSWSTCGVLELVVPPRSTAVGRTLQDLRIKERFGLTGVALWRGGQPVRTETNTLPLQQGDGVLLFGPRRNARAFEAEPQFQYVRGSKRDEAPKELWWLMPISVLIFLGVILSAALNLMPIAVAALAGAGAMVLAGVLDANQIYEKVQWSTIVLIGAMYSFGGAMEESGAAEQLAHLLSVSLNHFNPLVGLLVVGGVCMALTQPLHNAVVAVIMTPVALDFANSINANPRAFAVAVIVGASATFLMPVGHPASVLVQKPGSYRPKDYFVFGIGPCLIALATIGIVVPWIWPFDQ
jgi:di/tricarboxylate transporter